MEEILIKIDKPMSEFSEHLEANNRIFFLEGGTLNLRQLLSSVKNMKNSNPRVGRHFNHPPVLGNTILWTCYKIFGSQIENLLNAIKNAKMPSVDKRIFINLDNLASLILPLTTDIIRDVNQNDIFTFNCMDGKDIQYKLKEERSMDFSYKHTNAVQFTPINFDELKCILIAAVNKMSERRDLY